MSTELKAAIKLWADAHKKLHQGDVSAFFSSNNKFYDYMKEHKIAPDALQEALVDTRLSPKAGSALGAIIITCSEYSRGAATLEDPKNIESGFVSAISKQASFFMDCKLKPNQRLMTDPEVSIPTKEVALSLMNHIRGVANPKSKIGNKFVKTLMVEKMMALRASEGTPEEMDIIYEYKAGQRKSSQQLNTAFNQVKDQYNRWQDLSVSRTSNLNVASPNTASSAVSTDLARAAAVIPDRQVKINGIPLNEIAPAYHNFETAQDVTDFFSSVLLKDFKGSEEQREEAITYLKTAFHQGGLLYPVSSALMTELKDADGNLVGHPAAAGHSSSVNIQTTAEGFKVQEYAKVDSILVAHEHLLVHADKSMFLKAPSGSDALIKAEATIAVNFTKNPKAPSLTIENNQIAISHPKVNELLDHRSWGRKFLDWLKNTFSNSDVKDISPKTPDKAFVTDLEQRNNEQETPTAPTTEAKEHEVIKDLDSPKI